MLKSLLIAGVSLAFQQSPAITSDPAQIVGACPSPSITSPGPVHSLTVLRRFESPDVQSLVGQVSDLHRHYSTMEGDFQANMNQLYGKVRTLFSVYERRTLEQYRGFGVEIRGRYTMTSKSGEAKEDHFRLYPPQEMEFDQNSWRFEGSGLKNHWVKPREAAIHIRGQRTEGYATLRAYVSDETAKAMTQRCLDRARTELERQRLPTDRTPDFPT